MNNRIIASGILAALALAPAHAEPIAYEMDGRHTIIQFTWNHNQQANMSGRFLSYAGEFNLDFENPEQSSVSFTIDPNSVWTGVDTLDADMKSARLFDAATHNEIKFVSTHARQTGLDRGQLEGDLTIKGITKPVTLYIDVNYEGDHVFASDSEKYKDAKQAGLTIHTRINRSDFSLGMAVPWIADEIDIRIETELVAFPEGKP